MLPRSGASSFCILGLALATPVAASPDPVSVRCHVFHDLDASGFCEPGEPPLREVKVTNGVGVYATDPDGVIDLVVDREQYRFVTLVIPAGWEPTRSWFVRLPAGGSAPDSVDFGLRPRPASAADADSVRWIHIADTQVQTWTDPYRMDLDFQEINELPEPPLFLINTGDLVETGPDTTHWDHYVAQVAVSRYEVFPVVGNHDVAQTATPLANYEHYAGPPYYSFDAGNWHFIIYSGAKNLADSGTPAQDTWLAADLAAAPPGCHKILFQHYTLNETDAARVATWRAAGIEANFSGHWHSHLFGEKSNGMAEYNLSWLRNGAVDRTPRCFGIVTCTADGRIRYEQRRLRVDHRVQLVSPQTGQTVRRDAVELTVQAYDSAARVTSLTASLTAAGGAVLTTALEREGISAWRALLDASSLPAGDCSVSIQGSFEDGRPIALSMTCVLGDVVPIVRRPDEDWPMFRRSPAGTSFVARPLQPPLQLAWTRQVPGMVALSSPVVADGRVFLGCRPEREIEEGGVLACDAATGVSHWFAHVPTGVALAPAVADQLVLVTSMQDSVYALDASTGQRAWTVPQVEPRYTLTAPIFEEHQAWVGTEPRVRQVRLPGGSVDWTSARVGDPWYPVIYSVPAVSPTCLYFGFFGWSDPYTGGFKVVDRATGSLVYEEAGCVRSPLWDGARVYTVGALDRNHQSLCARDPGGAVVWTAPKDLGAGTGAPALAHGVIVVAGKHGAIEGFRAEDGANLWTKTVGPQLYDQEEGWLTVRATPGTPAIADQVVYVGSLDGKLYALDLQTGSEIWRWDLGVPVSSSPAISGNMLFVAAEDGRLYGFVGTPPGDGLTDAPMLPPGDGEFALLPPCPNPAAGPVRLDWVMPSRARVVLEVFDVGGRLVRTVASGMFAAGRHQARWEGTDRGGAKVAAGVYFARLQAGRRTAVQRLVHVRP